MVDRWRQKTAMLSAILALALTASIGLAAEPGVPAGSREKIRELIAVLDKLTADEILDRVLDPARGGITTGLEKYVVTAVLLNRREILQPPEKEKQSADGNAGLQAKLAKAANLLGADEDWRIRRLSVELLARQLSADVVPAYRQLLEDSAEPVRHRAIEALGMLPKGENIQILEKILAKHDETRVFDSVAAVWAMAELRHMPGLIEGLKDENVEVQLESIRGLARQPALSPETEKALQERMKAASDDRVRQRILKLLEKKVL